MAFGFNLLHSFPSPAYISNANIIPLLVIAHVDNGASYKIAHISGASILVDLQLFSRERGIQILRDNANGLLLGVGTFRLSFHYH